MLVVHHEPEDASACAATETVERLPRGIHVKGGALFFVKRTDRPKAGTGTLKWKIPADDLHNVAGIGDLLDTFFGDTWHEKKRLKASREKRKR
jgi:hypothetical protein